MNGSTTGNLYVTVQVNLHRLEKLEQQYPTMFKFDKSHMKQDYRIAVSLSDSRLRMDTVNLLLLEDDPFKFLYLAVITSFFVVPFSVMKEKKADVECQKFLQDMIRNRFSLIRAVITRSSVFFMMKKELLQLVFSEDTMKMYHAMETLYDLKGDKIYPIYTIF